MNQDTDDTNDTNRTMNLRFCLRIGLHSTWNPFASANGILPCNIILHKQDLLPSCWINLCVNLDTSLLHRIESLIQTIRYTWPRQAMITSRQGKLTFRWLVF